MLCPNRYQHYPKLADVGDIIETVRDFGFKPICYPIDQLREALMGQPAGEKELEKACEAIQFMGTKEVSTMSISLEVRQGLRGVPGRHYRTHRGGYVMDAFDLALMRKELAKGDRAAWAHHVTEQLTAEAYFANCVKVLQRLLPVAEDAGVRLMCHFDDPPVPDSEGLLPGITNPLLIDRLFDAAPSDAFGMLFCLGTRYESGVDIYQQIRHFGRKGKIFYIHFRNVRGTLPSAGGYEEVMHDDGDMDLFRVLQAFKAVGYDGPINPDHFPILAGDEKGRAAYAFAVGYIKALISAL